MRMEVSPDATCVRLGIVIIGTKGPPGCRYNGNCAILALQSLPRYVCMYVATYDGDGARGSSESIVTPEVRNSRRRRKTDP